MPAARWLIEAMRPASLSAFPGRVKGLCAAARRESAAAYGFSAKCQVLNLVARPGRGRLARVAL
jgi:hypothetical protein